MRYDYPVEQVSWNDVQEFIRKLNRETGQNYRLPTEAEWEYAARSGGNREKFAGTSSYSEVGEYAWCSSNYVGNTHPVRQKRPDGLGIYDMSGNVWEWCQDIYSEDAYKKHQRKNPIYIRSGSGGRVIRGGCWRSGPRNVRVANRGGSTPDLRSFILGFRLARTP